MIIGTTMGHTTSRIFDPVCLGIRFAGRKGIVRHTSCTLISAAIVFEKASLFERDQGQLQYARDGNLHGRKGPATHRPGTSTYYNTVG